MPREPMPDVIVVLPGIMGSVLQKDGKDLWALSPGAVLRGLTAGFESLALEDDPPDTDDLGDGIRATELFPDTHLVPGLWKIDGYSRITDLIQRAFDVERGENYFEFPYDWRRDNRIAAKRLAHFGRERLTSWRNKSGNATAKLILVAHSMGGIVSRYFLEVLDGWAQTRALVSFGTPYRGSLNALGYIANGFKKKLGPITLVDFSNMLRSFTSVYQLLPIYPCYDSGDGQLVRVAEAKALPNLDMSKVAEALRFHHEIRDGVSAHQSENKYREEGYQIFPIVGTHQETLQSARLENGVLVVVPEYEGRDLDGDGTVPRVSATPIELSDQRRETFAAQKHSSLQNSDVAWVQLEGILRGTQLNLSIFKGPSTTRQPQNRLRLLIDDAYESKEPIHFRVQPECAVASLGVTITNVETNQKVDLEPLPQRDAWLDVKAPPLPEGTYRVTVSGARPIVPVSDVFVVA